MRHTDDPHNVDNTPRGLHDPPPLSETRRVDAPTDARTVGDLMKELRNETTVLLRQEVALAKAEMAEKGSRIGRNVGYLVVGAAVGYLALVFLVFAAMSGLVMALRAAGLGPGIYGWLAPLIVGIVVAGIGYIMIQKAITTLRRETLVPKKTMASMQENKEWIGHKMK